jgi:hypothetical protein
MASQLDPIDEPDKGISTICITICNNNINYCYKTGYEDFNFNSKLEKKKIPKIHWDQKLVICCLGTL